MIEPYYETELGKLYHGDCLEIMPEIGPVDLVVTSPPYDDLREYNGYAFVFKCVANALYHFINDGGVAVWVVGDATINGSETGTSFQHALYFKAIGFNLHDTMIYRKQNPIPIQQGRYIPAFEYMFVISKGKPIAFNPLTERCINAGKRSSGRIVQPDGTRTEKAAKKYNDIKYKTNVFEYSVGKNDGIDHPGRFPVGLAQDQIVTWSNGPGIVADIMTGSGTVPLVCERLDRRWIGIEISEEYCEIAAKRIESETRQLKLFT